MKSQSPPEALPLIGTVDEPAYLMDQERNLLLCYEIAPAGGGGSAILSFSRVVHFEQKVYPDRNRSDDHQEYISQTSPWDFMEIFGSDRTERWSNPFSPKRFWTISFNDTWFEIVFSEVRLVHEDQESPTPNSALLSYLSSRG